MMSPLSRATANSQRLVGQRDGEFEPPPSTMAAQLISNISTVNRPIRLEQDDLQKLMTEVSEVENTQLGHNDPEIRVQHKHKLIYVFTRAVLERLAQDDPFMNVQQIAGHASEALDIFLLTIKDTPAVLNYTMKSRENLQTRGPEPLWLWLFPKILTLIGRRGCEPLTEKIKDLFYASFQVVARSPKLWNLNFPFFLYLKECSATLLEQLQKPTVISSNTRIGVMVPPKEFDYSVFSNEKYDLAKYSSQYCYQIRSSTEGICHITNLMAMLVDVSSEAASSYDATPAFQDYIMWLMDSFLTIHELQKRRRECSNLQQFDNKLEESSFEAMNALLQATRKFGSPIVLHKNLTLLSIFCADLMERPLELSGDPIRASICSCLLNLSAAFKIDAVCRLVAVSLSTVVVSTLGDEEICSALGVDFRKTAVTFCNAFHIEVPGASKQILDDSFQSAELNAGIRQLDMSLNLNTLADRSEAHPSKRRKISGNETAPLLGNIVSELYTLIGHQKANDLYGLAQVAEESFSVLADLDRCNAISLLGHVPCAANGTLTFVNEIEGYHLENVSCSVCDDDCESTEIASSDPKSQAILEEALNIFNKLVLSPSFLETRKPRVLAMFALKRFLHHGNSSSLLDTSISPLGLWCARSLKSSMRELRIAAGRTLPLFVQDNSEIEPIIQSNRVNVMSLLRTFAEEEPVHLQETCILAWAQVGRVLKDESFVFVLLGLVKYLGHTNPIVSGVAFNELLALSQSKHVTVGRMFSPFWSAIAIEAVKHLVIRPQTTQYMADLLGISVSEFLILTQVYSLPYLVLSKNFEVIRRITQARQDELDYTVCHETTNLASILALLLQQNVSDMESFVMSLLKGVSAKYETEDLTDVIRIEPSSTAFHLLVAAAEADESKKSRIRFAMQTLANRAPSSDLKSSRKGSAVGLFLEQHILGLVARFANLINNNHGEQSMIERVRYIKAVEELVKIAKSHARIARPHLCVCLQSAIGVHGLQTAAFSAWGAMLRNLDDDDVEVMLESTLSTIIQNWSAFDGISRIRATETLEYLLRERTYLIGKNIADLPSLSKIDALLDIESELQKLRHSTDTGNSFHVFNRRLRNENSSVVHQALVELKAYLRVHQSFLQASAISEQPDAVVGILVRSILDTCIKFNDSHHDIPQLCAECIGLIGCLDPNRVEAVREQREIIVVSDFHDSEETCDFVLFLLQEVIVPAFLSTTDTLLQGYFSWVMQQLLEACEFKKVCGPLIRTGDRSSKELLYQKWQALPSTVQDTLTPFLSSKYSIKEMEPPKYEYPIFRPDKMLTGKLYNFWLRAFVLDLLHKPFTQDTFVIYKPLTRAIRIKDLSVANFLLPYLVLHIILGGSDQQRHEIGEELLCILQYEAPPESQAVRKEDLKLCVEAVFRVLDYLYRWIQQKQIHSNNSRTRESAASSIALVRSVIDTIPAEIMSQRAIECKSYSRALFYWEQHIRKVRDYNPEISQEPELLERLQDIYSQIDEPDGIEGISAHLYVLDVEQQVLAHRKAGRWTTAQSWYEIRLAEQPDNLDVQINLLTCLKESGQHDVLLNYVEGMHTASTAVSRLLPFAAEASWATGRWAALEKYTSIATADSGDDFNISVGQALLALYKDKNNTSHFKSIVGSLRQRIASSLSAPMTASLASSHDSMLKLHVLTELEMIAGTDSESSGDRALILESLNRRLEVIGAYLNDKQYLLGIRRAAMKLSSLEFTEGDISESWLTSARLARKGNAIHQSFNAVLHASQLGDESATIEHARLLWKDGHHRKAIQSLQGAIDSNAFIAHNRSIQETNLTDIDPVQQENFLTARAFLMLAKWQDAAGQSQSGALRSQYQKAAKAHGGWEKGHYYLGRYYNKLLESEKALPVDQQKENFNTGEMSKLVVENYLRALSYGTKYLYQMLPRVLTLWLDLGLQVTQPLDTKLYSKEYVTRVTTSRKDYLSQLHQRFSKYIVRLPAYMFYTALPQVLSRIAHPNQEVYKYLQQIIVKVVSAYPQYSLWNLLAVCNSNQPDRKNRGTAVLQALQQSSKKAEASDMRGLIKSGIALSEQLITACNAGDFQGNRTTLAKLTRDLGFKHNACTPSKMAVPFERVLRATLPTLTDNIRAHKAFSGDVITIESFEEDVLVLSSLQKPRKLTARGSDGRRYGLMCKPKDDLRKDQRLMEFNSMINRALKRDAEASRRQLYIKTYAVTPLNEECGLIEWVDGLKTLRDVLLSLYKARGISPNYNDIAAQCEYALKREENIAIYTDKVLAQFPPIFHLWFVQQFPEPSAWFAARLRYTRSCAVMSMVGTILGLGDRHGENILFEEGNGGTFHVDFNCLFDKGLTFSKPERVPFRLTHNMVDAMGMYGYEGPFRKSSELTLNLLRQHEETLMTILEAFVYDPTLDLLAKKTSKKKPSDPAQTPQGVLDTILRKVKGHMPGETVPLGVEGQVDELIAQATNVSFLAGMYIGWCSFL